jgi:flagellar basal-body rod protein FlgC
MDLFRTLGISASGLSAQRARMDVISENLANSESATPGPTGLYRRKLALLEPLHTLGFGRFLSDGESPEGGVRVTGVVQSQEPPRRVHQPGHPLAGPDGYVELPNVNPLVEMLDMLAATRAYEANATAFQATKSIATKLLELLR